MRFLKIDGAGNIVATIICADNATGLAQLAAGQSLYGLDDSIGLVDDSRLMLANGVLTLKDPAKPAANSGTALTAVIA